MSKLSRCYKKWWPAIWAIIISVIVVVLILFSTQIYGKEYPDKTKHKMDKIERQDLKEVQNVQGKEYRERLDALFTKWDSILDEEHKEIGTTLRTIATSLSIWIGIIAAICTILPIVIGINANSNFQKDIAQAKDEMSKAITGLETKMKTNISQKETTFNDKVAETEKQLQTKVDAAETRISETAEKQEQKMQELRITLDEILEISKTSQIAQALSDLSVHMRVISELQEFESHDKGTLTKVPLLQRVLENLVAELGRIKENIQQDNSKETTFVSILLILCMLKRLLIAVESSFKDYDLLSLQKLKSKIDYKVTTLMDVSTDSTKNKDLISLTHGYANSIKELFEDHIKDNK